MRNLTLGVLIVAGGTLAALPFRRDDGTPDASREPTHATGPVESIFDQPSAHSLVTEDPNQAQRREITRDLAGLIGPSPSLSSSGRYPTGSSRSLSRRRLSPLTFEDLLEPIERPNEIKERFGAVAGVRDEGLALHSDEVMASGEALADASSPPHSARFQVIEPRIERRPRKASGSLASVSRREMMPPERADHDDATLTFVQRLPKPNIQPEPSRHWIQQPK